jgi:hypothetical protein
MEEIDRRKAGLQGDQDPRDPARIQNDGPKAPASDGPGDLPEGIARPRKPPLNPTHGRSADIPAHVPGGRRN